MRNFNSLILIFYTRSLHQTTYNQLISSVSRLNYRLSSNPMLIALISVNQIQNHTCKLMYLNSHQQSRNQRFEAKNRSSSRNWDEDDYHIEFRLIEIGLSHDRWANRVCKEDIWEGVRLKRRRRFFFFFFCFLNWFLTKKTMWWMVMRN